MRAKTDVGNTIPCLIFYFENHQIIISIIF